MSPEEYMKRRRQAIRDHFVYGVNLLERLPDGTLIPLRMSAADWEAVNEPELKSDRRSNRKAVRAGSKKEQRARNREARRIGTIILDDPLTEDSDDRIRR